MLHLIFHFAVRELSLFRLHVLVSPSARSRRNLVCTAHSLFSYFIRHYIQFFILVCLSFYLCCFYYHCFFLMCSFFIINSYVAVCRELYFSRPDKPVQKHKHKLTKHEGPVKENQLMLKGVVSNFIVLIEILRHVSASKRHLQGVTRSL
jgi:hypothetical protein